MGEGEQDFFAIKRETEKNSVENFFFSPHTLYLVGPSLVKPPSCWHGASFTTMLTI